MDGYIKIEEDIEFSDFIGPEEIYDDSFLSQIRKKRSTYLNNLKGLAEEGAKKYLSIPVYNNIKLLHTDVEKIMKKIGEMAHDRNIISFKIEVSNESWLDGFKELNKIYSNFAKESLHKNKLFLSKFWSYARSTLEMFTMALAEKTGIHKQNEMPKLCKEGEYKHVYEPSEGIYIKLDKYYFIYVWY